MRRRTSAGLARLAAAAATAAAVTLTSTPASSGADGFVVPPAHQRIDAAGDAEIKDIEVKWAGDGERDYVESARVQGIGNIKLVCKPDNTIIKLTPDTRDAETQMWLAKYEDKNGAPAVAVKNVRIYKYANANDDGTGGTGRSAHEGLNQRGDVENWAKGYAYGLISQRPGRNHPAGGVPLTRTTSFYLTWYWNGLNEPRAYQSCDLQLRLVSSPTERVGLNWHGNDDAAGNTVTSAAIAGFGQLTLTCEPGRDNEQSIVLDPDLDDGWVYTETITGEGRVEDHVESGSYDYDADTGLIGPVELPRNGMLRIQYTVPDGTGGWQDRWFYLSAYMVLNNALHPELNLCEIAVAGAADQ